MNVILLQILPVFPVDELIQANIFHEPFFILESYSNLMMMLLMMMMMMMIMMMKMMELKIPVL